MGSEYREFALLVSKLIVCVEWYKQTSFYGNFCERLAKTFQFMKMICGDYSRSYFNLF